MIHLDSEAGPGKVYNYFREEGTSTLPIEIIPGKKNLKKLIGKDHIPASRRLSARIKKGEVIF